LLRRAAIFAGEVRYRFPGVKTRRDYSSGYAGSRDDWLSESNHRIDLNRFWFGRARLDYKWKEPEHPTWVDFDPLEMRFIEIQVHLPMLGHVNDLPEPFDKEIPAVGKKGLVNEWMGRCIFFI
jgi:hypothetical protein